APRRAIKSWQPDFDLHPANTFVQRILDCANARAVSTIWQVHFRKCSFWLIFNVFGTQPSMPSFVPKSVGALRCKRMANGPANHITFLFREFQRSFHDETTEHTQD